MLSRSQIAADRSTSLYKRWRCGILIESSVGDPKLLLRTPKALQGDLKCLYCGTTGSKQGECFSGMICPSKGSMGPYRWADARRCPAVNTL